MNSLRKYLFISLALVAFVACVALASGNASADTHVWDGEDAGALFSTDANWRILNGANDVEPTAGDDIKFWDVDDACTWDVTTSINSVVIAANYSGTITQGANDINIGAGGYSQAGGTFAGRTTQWVNVVGGTFSRAAGTVGTYLCLHITDGTCEYYPGGITRLWFTGTCSNTHSGYQDDTASLRVDSGGVLSTSARMELINNAFSVQIDGNVLTPGAAYLLMDTNVAKDLNISGHVEDLAVALRASGASGSVTCTLINSLNVDTFTVNSGHATYTITLNLNGHSLSCTSLTLGARGILSGAGSHITTTGAITVAANGKLNATNIPYIDCGGNFDPSAGTWVPGISQVNMTNSYKAVKLAAGQTLYDLSLVNNINVTGAANVTHNLFYEGLTASLHYHWYYGSTLIASYTANATGVVNIGARVLAVQNLYHTHAYPFITTVPAASVIEDHAYLYDANADMAGTWSIVTNATWATFATGTAVLSGVPDNGDVAIYSVSIRITAANGTEFLNYSLTVTNVAPVFNSVPNAEASLGFVYMYHPSTDEDAWVTWTLTSDSPAMQLDSTGLVYGHIKDVDAFYFNITANDGKGGISYQNVSMSVVFGAMNPHVEINATEAGRLRIVFSAELTNAPQEYILAMTWNFGDGIGSHEANPVHSYPSQGTYLVTVAMWLINGDIAYKQIYVSPGDPLQGATTSEAVSWWASTYGTAALGSVAIGMLLSLGYAAVRKKKRKNVKTTPLLILWLGIGMIIFLIITGGLF